MNRTFARVAIVAALLGTSSATSAKDDEPEYVYFPKALTAGKTVPVPACTPLVAKYGPKTVLLEDPNNHWGKTPVLNSFWDSAGNFIKFDACLAAAPQYKGRYTPEMVASLRKGQLVAGMPFEFALMILGPPPKAPTVMSVLNPVTNQPDTIKAYVWIEPFKRANELQLFLSIVGTVAIGVAGTTSNLDTAVDALTVANAAMTASIVAWDLTSLSSSKLVTIQTTTDGRISMFMAQ